MESTHDEAQSHELDEHSLRFLEMAFRTDREGTPPQSDGHGKKTGDCGDSVEIFLTLRGDRIEAVNYLLDGCMHTNAGVNAVACLAEGKTLESAWEISVDRVIDFLRSLPEDHHHCAELALGTFYLALADCRKLRRTPWKKVYR